jgi:hypothetical protein
MWVSTGPQTVRALLQMFHLKNATFVIIGSKSAYVMQSNGVNNSEYCQEQLCTVVGVNWELKMQHKLSFLCCNSQITTWCCHSRQTVIHPLSTAVQSHVFVSRPMNLVFSVSQVQLKLILLLIWKNYNRCVILVRGSDLKTGMKPTPTMSCAQMYWKQWPWTVSNLIVVLSISQFQTHLENPIFCLVSVCTSVYLVSHSWTWL